MATRKAVTSPPTSAPAILPLRWGSGAHTGRLCASCGVLVRVTRCQHSRIAVNYLGGDTSIGVNDAVSLSHTGVGSPKPHEQENQNGFSDE